MECNDKNCPVHGSIRYKKGKIIRGEVKSTKAKKTATVIVDYVKYMPKYERYERRRSYIHAHNPPCIEVKPGDVVELAPIRRISKTKAYAILKVIGNASN